MRPHLRLPRIGFVLLALLVAACSTLPKDFKDPTVSLVSIKPQIRNLFAPEFDIVLRVSNPNRQALDVTGLSYSIDLQGRRVIQGVANELPLIPAYGEADVSLRATADLVGSLDLLRDLLDQPEPTVEFVLDADLDLGGLYPTINIRRNGSISLQ